MLEKNEKLNKKTIITAAVAFIGGFFNGFIGAGGGVIMMLGLYFLRRFDDSEVKNREFAGNGAAVCVFSLVSSATYALTDRVEWSLLPPMILPAAIGGAVGGALLKKIDPVLLRFVFSFVVLYSGISMLKRVIA